MLHDFRQTHGRTGSIDDAFFVCVFFTFRQRHTLFPVVESLLLCVGRYYLRVERFGQRKCNTFVLLYNSSTPFGGIFGQTGQWEAAENNAFILPLHIAPSGLEQADIRDNKPRASLISTIKRSLLEKVDLPTFYIGRALLFYL